MLLQRRWSNEKGLILSFFACTAAGCAGLSRRFVDSATIREGTLRTGV